MAKLLDLTPSSTRSEREKFMAPPGLESPLMSRKDLPSRQLSKSKSQPKVAASKGA